MEVSELYDVFLKHSSAAEENAGKRFSAFEKRWEKRFSRFEDDQDRRFKDFRDDISGRRCPHHEDVTGRIDVHVAQHHGSQKDSSTTLKKAAAKEALGRAKLYTAIALAVTAVASLIGSVMWVG